MANIYDKVPVKVQRRSGFDKSFQNLFSSKVGTITPILTDELIPNSTVNLKIAMTTQLPPLASDTFMRVKQKYAAFFVPTRLLVGHYEKWLTNQKVGVSSTSDASINPVLPTYRWTVDSDYACVKPGTLADYLGYKVSDGHTDLANFQGVTEVSALPFLAYHRIYNDWFRNSLVQKDIYLDVTSNSPCASCSPRVCWTNESNSLYMSLNSGGTFSNTTVNAAHQDWFADGVHLWELRQANFGSDMFTSCSPTAQNGDAQSVSINEDTTSFTISALRAANSMQQFLERNNLCGNRMVDFVKAQYGANLNDAIAQRAILLGSGSFDVYSKGIYQTSNAQTGDANLNNPMANTVGAKYGSAYVDGNDFVIKGFTAQEPGYLMVVTWLSPKVTYSTGINPMLTRYVGTNKQSDMANPILQNVGNEPLYAKYIDGNKALEGGTDTTVFGYNDRYCTWKDCIDEVHGILRDGSSLQSFALQRTFDDATAAAPEISSDFLKIPTDYLNQVSSVSEDVSSYGYWTDSYFDYKVVMPLAKYSIPSLENPSAEHGDDVMINKGGTSLS